MEQWNWNAYTMRGLTERVQNAKDHCTLIPDNEIPPYLLVLKKAVEAIRFYIALDPSGELRNCTMAEADAYEDKMVNFQMALKRFIEFTKIATREPWGEIIELCDRLEKIVMSIYDTKGVNNPLMLRLCQRVLNSIEPGLVKYYIINKE